MLRRTIEITPDCWLEPTPDPQLGAAVLVVNVHEGEAHPKSSRTYLDAQTVRALRAALYEAIE